MNVPASAMSAVPLRQAAPISPESAMQRALALAALGASSTHPNPRVGCVIVKDGVVIGEGWHHRAGEAHAEVHALAQAGASARGADVYVTLEPCAHHGRTPPCADALVAAGVARVTAAITDPDPRVAGGGLARLQAAGIAVSSGLCAAEASELNRGFLSRLSRKRPWVTLKLAASLDGRTALANGDSQWITGMAARADVHRLRAAAGAVLVGADTTLADDPSLTVRDWMPPPGTSLRQPDRIVLDAAARVPPGAKVWTNDGTRRFWLVGAPEGEAPSIPAVDPGVELSSLPPGVDRVVFPLTAEGHLSLPAVLSALAWREVGEVLVEAGPRLAGALLQAGLVDELLIYLAPKLLGDTARPLAQLPALKSLAAAPQFQFHEIIPIGDDLRISLRPQGGQGPLSAAVPLHSVHQPAVQAGV